MKEMSLGPFKTREQNMLEKIARSEQIWLLG